MMHKTIGCMLRPTALTLAVYLGCDLKISTIFSAVFMIDWLAWPLHMLPHFLSQFRDARRSMRRI
jgi:hypothetical protein